MDQRGSLVDTKLKINPSKKLLDFLYTLSADNLPSNILKLKGKECNKEIDKTNFKEQQFNNTDYENLNKIKEIMQEEYGKIEEIEVLEDKKSKENDSRSKFNEPIKEKNATTKEKDSNIEKEYTDSETSANKDEDVKTTIKQEEAYLVTSDIDWLYAYLKELRKTNKDIPFLHTLLEGSLINMPENKIIKRNPILEARCVKLRAQQEAREYRKMTKTVDNVRLRFPEDSISYQLKQLNRQLIAIGQFLLSIFAGFLFGFRGVEWMVGNLDFGFRLLLGVMCALVIALAEIYFLAKKLNEELNIPETVQLGGPPKFAENSPYANSYTTTNKVIAKEHQD